MEPLYIEESSQETTASSPLKLHPSGLMYEELSCDPEAAASPSINNEGAANEGAGNEDTANLKDAASEAPATEAPGEEAAAAEEGCKPTPHPLSLPDLLEEGACDGFETPNGRRKRVAHKPVEPPGSIPNVASSVTKDGVKPAKVSVFDRLEKRPAAAQQRHKGDVFSRLGEGRGRFNPVQEAIPMARYNPRPEAQPQAEHQPQQWSGPASRPIGTTRIALQTL
ncbi:uncharacterized protein LOC127749029 [Frankliniella occidentalis]|uniref:Uncharacterized protein LOC127749029 n=1 Tax=Frankliniella occidentalis TaxID=133901 RepID=A0A9C6WWB5_FRAOC|nr:uncharacterized protein LOC127749029 [Frankliniella occidentalis]